MDLFKQLKESVYNIDPVAFCEKNLNLDGAPFKINGNGYKPFADIYRYVGIKALEKNSKPIVMVKGRQVGATTMAVALQLYFMTSGTFGNNGRAPMRVIHAFPTLVHVFNHAKTKLNPIIKSANLVDDPSKPGKKISCIEAKLDKKNSGDSLQYKQFIGDNYIRIESTGLDADRLRGGTVDALLYDECFPYSQNIQTSDGKIPIGRLHNLFSNNKDVPKVLTFNEKTESFEYKKILNSWNRGKRSVYELTCENRKIRCTGNHRFLTIDGWKRVDEMNVGDLIKSTSDSKFHNSDYTPIDSIKELDKKEVVYDIEVEDNHNFIVSPEKSKKNGGLIAHNCQDIPAVAIANANKLLTTSRYGKVGKGIQLYFGTPKQRGSEYYKMWESSNQQYYYLGCEGCDKHFPLYTPGSNEWENIWVHGFIVKCTHCGHMQDKRAAAERGKWVESRPLEECQMIGFHINQLYNPRFQKEDIIAEKPENSPVNTERDWQNEVLGEFYAGEMGPITPEQIREFCADFERKMRPSISITENKRVFAGFDWGKRSDADAVGSAAAKLAGGQSYSTCVILTEDGTRLSIDYATIIKKNDPAYKKSFIDEVMRKYSVTQAVGDIGYAADLTHTIQSEYGDRFLASELVGKVNGNVRYDDKEFPKIIRASREYYIEELFNVMKQGRIRFPFGNYEMITWLIEHCTSMGVKTTLNSVYEPVRRYVKGSKPNDGFMALLNAYLAYKFHATDAFKNKKGGLMEIQDKKQILAITGYCPRM